MKRGVRTILTYGCSKGCVYCYQKSFDRLVVDPAALKQALHSIDDQVYQHVTIMGGEVAEIPNLELYLEIITNTLQADLFSVTTNRRMPMDFYAMCLKYVDNITVSNINLARDLVHEFGKNCIRLNLVEGYYTPEMLGDVLQWGRATICAHFDKTDLTFPTFPGFVQEPVNSYSMDYVGKVGRFRYFLHTDYERSEWIVLPSGRITDDFEDVVQGKA